MASLAEIDRLGREIAEEAKERISGVAQATAELQGRSIEDLITLKKFWVEELARHRKLDDQSIASRTKAEYHVEAIEQLLRNPSRLTGASDNLNLRDSSNPLKNPDSISAGEAAHYLGISLSTLYKMTSKNVLPFRRVGGKILSFSKNELDVYLQSKRNRTGDEIEKEADRYLDKKKSKKGIGL